MTTAHASTTQMAIGYSNGILYLEHEAPTACSILSPTDDYNRGNNNIDYDNDDDDGGDDGDVFNGNDGNHANHHHIVDGADATDDDNDESLHSFGSMETLSDNVAIWVDGEKHWISGVDANTTCADLIHALINYQDIQKCQEQSKQAAADNESRQVISFNNNNNNQIQNKHMGNGNNAINQLDTQPTATTTTTTTTNNAKEELDTTNNNSSNDKNIDTNVTAAATAAAAAAALIEFAIVKQHRHYEEYLDGSTKVFDVLPSRDMTVPARRKECELQLRRLGSAGQMNAKMSSLLCNDKDSGMGSPVGSSRSAKFRRRKYKSAQWLAQANTLHPKLSQRCSATANERLMKIIMAQDETIHRQLALLREKERQISKIEEEKHRKRERELGKNYLLETYLKGLDEAGAAALAIEPIEPENEQEEVQDDMEIFIDEPYQRCSGMTKSKSHRKQPQQQHQRKTAKEKDKKNTKQSITGNATNADAAETITREADKQLASSSNAGNQKEIELQILWLEKVYTLNKQLQREEELMLKLQAKIRKHQEKRVFQTKRELMQQIDKFNNDLARNGIDIQHTEDALTASNTELKTKLCTLEKLNAELMVCEVNEQSELQSQPKPQPHLQSEPQQTTRITIAAEQQHGIDLITKNNKDEVQGEVEYNGAPTLPASPTPPSSGALTALQNLNNNNIFHATANTADLLTLQKIIDKPETSRIPAAATTTAAATALALLPPPTTTTTTTATTTAHQQEYEKQHHNYPISLINHCGIVALNKHTITDIDATSEATAIATSSQQQQQQQQLMDKNMLPMYAHTVKTIKKQMFAPKYLNHVATTALTAESAVATVEATSSTPHINTTVPPDIVVVDISRMGTLV